MTNRQGRNRGIKLNHKMNWPITRKTNFSSQMKQLLCVVWWWRTRPTIRRLYGPLIIRYETPRRIVPKLTRFIGNQTNKKRCTHWFSLRLLSPGQFRFMSLSCKHCGLSKTEWALSFSICRNSTCWDSPTKYFCVCNDYVT